MFTMALREVCRMDYLKPLLVGGFFCLFIGLIYRRFWELLGAVAGGLVAEGFRVTEHPRNPNGFLRFALLPRKDNIGGCALGVTE